MLSKISLAINAVLLILVINLYIQNCDENNEENVIVEQSENDDTNFRIAFLNTDTLDLNYQFTIDAVETLQKEMEKKQRRLERKATKLQQEYQMLQQSARSMTPVQLQAAQQRVVQMEQEIQNMQNDLSNELAQEQNDLQIKLINQLDSFLLRYNERENYDYIIKKHAASEVLIANTKYDITEEVLEMLNKEYLGEDVFADSL